MAELVDALVSNTSGSNTVPVRSRLRVQTEITKALITDVIEAFLFVQVVIKIKQNKHQLGISPADVVLPLKIM